MEKAWVPFWVIFGGGQRSVFHKNYPVTLFGRTIEFITRRRTLLVRKADNEKCRQTKLWRKKTGKKF
jgi:hypothetical protein